MKDALICKCVCIAHPWARTWQDVFPPDLARQLVALNGAAETDVGQWKKTGNIFTTTLAALAYLPELEITAGVTNVAPRENPLLLDGVFLLFKFSFLGKRAWLF